jgi:hypothetical protein
MDLLHAGEGGPVHDLVGGLDDGAGLSGGGPFP